MGRRNFIIQEEVHTALCCRAREDACGHSAGRVRGGCECRMRSAIRIQQHVASVPRYKELP